MVANSNFKGHILPFVIFCPIMVSNTENFMITIIFRFDKLKVLKLTVKAGISRPFSKISASPKEPGTNAFVTQTESPVGEEVVYHRF